MGLTAFVFARGGSKGLPGKNVKPFAGKPLIWWAVQQALSVPVIGRVVVSTDSQEIAEVAVAAGAEAPFLRPAALAGDTAREWDAWRHALTWIAEAEGALPDPFVSVPVTAPLRDPGDIAACIDTYRQGGSDIVLTVTEAAGNPWFNMVRARDDGTLMLVNSPDGMVVRRQDAPPVFDITPIAYVADPRHILVSAGLFAGRVRAVEVPPERSIDIDTALDFEIAEFLMRRRMGMTDSARRAA